MSENHNLEAIAAHWLDHLEPMYRGSMSVKYPYCVGVAISLGIKWEDVAQVIDDLKESRERTQRIERKAAARAENLERQRRNLERKRGTGNV